MIGALLAFAVACLALWFAAPMLRRPEWRGQARDIDELVQGWAGLRTIPGVIFRSETAAGEVIAAQSGARQDTPFHIASVGKLFTAVTLLRLAEQGRLSLDAPAAQYLGTAPLAGLVVIGGHDHGPDITVRQLLTHTAGLGNTDKNWRFSLTVLLRPRKVWEPADLLQAARRVAPVGPPGHQTAYSSPGYYLLGLVIEAVTGHPFHRVVRQEVLDPLGMANTFETRHEWRDARPILRHRYGRLRLSDHHPSFEYADGGFVSIAADVTRFGLAVLDGHAFATAEHRDLFFAAGGGPDAGTVQGHGPAVLFRDGAPVRAWQAGFWGSLIVLEPPENRVTVIALGQARADPEAFWRAARPLMGRDRAAAAAIASAQ